MVGCLATGEWESFHICLEGQSLIVFLLVNIFSNDDQGGPKSKYFASIGGL